MPNYSTSDTSQNSQGNFNRSYQTLMRLLRGKTEENDYFTEHEEIDTYRTLLRFRELLRGGQITSEEYERVKTELIFKR